MMSKRDEAAKVAESARKRLEIGNATATVCNHMSRLDSLQCGKYISRYAFHTIPDVETNDWFL